MKTLRWTLGLAVAGAAVALVAGPAWADQPSDAWITTKVKMALLTEPQVDGLDINVDTFDGRVTLHGQADSEAESAAAESRAGEIEGVLAVRNLLAVVPEEARERVEVADEDLARKIRNVLSEDAALDGSEVEIASINDGVVVLSGEAETLSAHRRAIEKARGVAGVRQVASEIRSPDELGDAEIWNDRDLSTEAASLMSDGWITAKAKVFLMAEQGISPAAVNVDSRAGVVTLFGIVPNEDAKRRAEQGVAKLDGVRSVENELQVVADVAADRVAENDDEIGDQVENRLAERQALEDADIDIEVSNAVVRLTGTVENHRDRLTALTVARGTNGVRAVVDDLTLAVPSGN